MEFKTFNISRDAFKPYGLTCEKWVPRIMPRIDRHNEIEINLTRRGSLSYFFRDCIVTVPQGKITIFWGLVPHRIVAYDSDEYYYVVTVPLAMFLKWGLPENFVNHVLKGELLIDNNATPARDHDSFLFEEWERDITANPAHMASMLEIRARLLRLSQNYETMSAVESYAKPMATKIEAMSLFIARNYTDNLTAKAIAHSAGITPDYANVLFKKTFGHSLTKQVTIERINHAQRELLCSSDPVSQIALDCGFNSISCFNSAFRKLNGCSPTEYRKANRQQPAQYTLQSRADGS